MQVLSTSDPPGPAVFPAGTALASPPALALSRKDTDFAPRIVIDYKATKNILLCASYSQGFKSGGFNAFRGSNPVFSPAMHLARQMACSMACSSSEER